MRAQLTQLQESGQRSASTPLSGYRTRTLANVEDEGHPEEHPLGKSRAALTRNHWVPTIPGYGGHIPGKHGENICGGGMATTCKMAGRAIAECNLVREPHPSVTMEDGLARSRIGDFYHDARRSGSAGPAMERAKVATHVREHCERHIPGYTGHVPRVYGESIFGATSRAANLIAADIAEHRILYPEDALSKTSPPQAPEPRQLRL